MTEYEEIKAAADRYFLPVYSRFDAVLRKGKGAVLKDVRGNSYIDFTAGIGVASLGFGDRAWARAVSRQARRLAHSSNLYYNEPSAMLAKTLCDRSGFERVFFCNSGAEANECAVKAARKYSFDKYGRGRHFIVTLKDSFHGRTMATLSATGQKEMHHSFFPFNEGFKYVDPDADIEPEILINGDVCAVMLEFIRGEGGVLPLSHDFARRLSALCREKDILLIADEVQTGIGRTGKLFAFENYGLRPDIVTSAKGLGNGLPIGACLFGEKAAQAMGAGDHGSTFGGNPIACAGALEVLKRIDEDFLREVVKKGDYIRSCLSGCPSISEISGAGLMIGLKLKGREARAVAEECLGEGLLVLTAKERLRLLPPLNISFEELRKGTEILKRVLCREEEEK